MNAKTCLFAIATVFAAAQAHAQEAPDEPMPRELTAVMPDATFRALRDRVVAIRTRDGVELVGQVLADDSATVTLALLPSRRVCLVAKADVVDLRLAEAMPAAAASPIDLETPRLSLSAVAPQPERERHFGLNFGLNPAIDLDLDAGMFHGFLNASLVLPMASDGQVLGFGAGGGVSFHVRPRSHWKLDVFAAITPSRLGTNSGDGSAQWLVGFGVGFGAHYTARNGFTIGFKAPVLGWSVGNGLGSSSGSAVAGYYLSAVMGLPMVSLGYRF